MILPVGVATLLVVAGCNQSTETNTNPSEPATNEASTNVTMKDVREKAGETVETAAMLGEQTKDEYVQSIKEQMKKVDAQVDTLKTQLQGLAQEAKANAQSKIDLLNQKRQAAQAKLDELSQASDEAWQKLKQGMVKATAQMDQALKDAQAAFKSGEETTAPSESGTSPES